MLYKIWIIVMANNCWTNGNSIVFVSKLFKMAYQIHEIQFIIIIIIMRKDKNKEEKISF